jgi:UPF0755 protein
MSAKKTAIFKKHKSVWLTTLALMLVLIVAASIKIYEDVFASNINLNNNEKGYVFIYTNQSFDENMERLEQSGLLKNARAFSRLAKLTGYHDLVKPGRYEVTNQTNNLELLRLIVSGRQTPIDVVFKYAQRKTDLVQFWSAQLEADSNELYALLNDSAFCDSLGFNTENVLSVFMPNTYNLYWTTSARKLVYKMHTAYQNFWNQERLTKLETLHLTRNEVSTLAAIVQKETYRSDEMPIVAGAYLNRLRKGMPLQADPTLIYAMNDNSIKRVGGAMLQVESAYNTYKYKGLPPGPICTPSAKAIDAVLNYSKHNYIYFCAKEDFSGYHNFASNFAQHQLNARKYQRELNKRGVHK